MSPHILVANKNFPEIALNLLRRKAHVTVVPFLDHEEGILNEIKNNIRECDALIWNTEHRLTGEILDLAGPQLKVISKPGTLIGNVDVDAVKKRGILLSHARYTLDDAVPDLAVGLMIAAGRRFKQSIKQLESGEWKFGKQFTPCQEIAGSVVGIVGLGGIGQEIVRRLKGFNVAKFLYCGPRDKPEANVLGVQRVSLEQLLTESDYVILACAFIEETKHLINSHTLSFMKPTAVLVNISRGGVVDQDALYEALKENRIFAAGLDVVTPEPIPSDHKLLTLPNCYIVPHLGSATINTRNKMATIAAKNVLLGLEGKPLLFPVI
ncbi:glyoxylate reductase/hydroxypyruvate reductase isoform X2 [Manduca sexta]|uniref:glyoxylate reductase/hydroxypyruvate reductase isoform X2 n=1 Tax=Manduca sexta TaxID=7130 RepID=UPI00188DEDF7|nr:glyoxylate reductase/hydroxypyruvate reductase isoform X2 [Manduca sexta]